MKCNYCGKELQPRYVTLLGREVFVGYTECDCLGAKVATQDAEELVDIQETKVRYYTKAGIPKRYLANVMEPSKSYVDAAISTGLFIFGNVGSGKTTMAAEIAKKLIDSNRWVRFANVTTLLDDIRETYSGGSTSAAIKKLTGYDLLIIDDLGKEYMSRDALSLIYRVVDGRYNAMRPLLITSNFSPNELAEKMSQGGNKELAMSITSRLQDCKVVKLAGGDRRKK